MLRLQLTGGEPLIDKLFTEVIGINQHRQPGGGQERHPRQVDHQHGRLCRHRREHRVGQLRRGRPVHRARDRKHHTAVELPLVTDIELCQGDGDHQRVVTTESGQA